jgi:hypothetical protein
VASQEDPPDKRELAVLVHRTPQEGSPTRDVQALFASKPFSANIALRPLRERGLIVLGSVHAVGRWVF